MGNGLSPVRSRGQFLRQYRATQEDYLEIVNDFRHACDHNKHYIRKASWDKLWKDDCAAMRECMDKVWAAFDVDHNGKMTLAEFLLFIGVQQYGTLRQRIAGSFAVYDVNHDGHLDRDELRDMFQFLSKLKLARQLQALNAAIDSVELRPDVKKQIDALADKFLATLDTDHSGSLDFEEVLAGCARDPECLRLFGGADY